MLHSVSKMLKRLGLDVFLMLEGTGNYRHLITLTVTAITGTRDAICRPSVLDSRVCFECSRCLPTLAGNIYTRNFATAFAAVRQRMPLQEPFGNSRPQAFFFPGFASPFG